jgi:hypothetical protein
MLSSESESVSSLDLFSDSDPVSTINQLSTSKPNLTFPSNSHFDPFTEKESIIEKGRSLALHKNLFSEESLKESEVLDKLKVEKEEIFSSKEKSGSMPPLSFSKDKSSQTSMDIKKTFFKDHKIDVKDLEVLKTPLRVWEEKELENLTEEEFIILWEEFRTKSHANRGWTQIELIQRFPEFISWLKKMSPR